ncbi:MAG TPA: hypothetical protein VD862_03005 [Candidatus Paceibacterota bacterium]|nr:hypothetical protein [Candidatus Paceibacterota bacterium]
MKRLAIAVLCALGVIWLVEKTGSLAGAWTDAVRQAAAEYRQSPDGVYEVPAGRSGWTPSGLQPVVPPVPVRPPKAGAATEAPEPAAQTSPEPRHGKTEDDGFRQLIPR